MFLRKSIHTYHVCNPAQVTFDAGKISPVDKTLAENRDALQDFVILQLGYITLRSNSEASAQVGTAL